MIMVFDTINFVLYQILIIVNMLLHECFCGKRDARTVLVL